MVAPSMLSHVRRKLSDKCNRLGMAVLAVKSVKVIAAVLVGFFLLMPHGALAQEPDEAASLNNQVVQLYKQGRYSERYR
jgi:hypothetical protein